MDDSKFIKRVVMVYLLSILLDCHSVYQYRYINDEPLFKGNHTDMYLILVMMGVFNVIEKRNPKVLNMINFFITFSPMFQEMIRI